MVWRASTWRSGREFLAKVYLRTIYDSWYLSMAIWQQNRYIVGGLTLAILGHWSLILQGGCFLLPCIIPSLSICEPLTGVQLKAAWVPGIGCQIMETNNRILAAIFIYSMCFDLAVLLLSTYRIFGFTSFPSRDFIGRSRLAQMIFADGLIFFILA